MKKKIYINPAIYLVFIIAVVGAINFSKRSITTENYLNLAQQIATYIFTIVLIWSVYWIGKDIIRPIPLTYDSKEIIIKRYFKRNLVISYKDIARAEYYNRYMRLEIHTKDKKYKFGFVVNTKELIEILKKKVKNNNF